LRATEEQQQKAPTPPTLRPQPRGRRVPSRRLRPSPPRPPGSPLPETGS
jgi:hypothetical protein